MEEGQDRPLIFIHGWLGSKDFWKLITPYIELDNPMVFYNQRCHSSSNSGFDMDTLAEDLHGLIEELGLENPVLIGHSMGGMTALQYVMKYRNFSGLCLLGTSASTPEPENRSVKYFLDNFDRLDRKEWAEKITENYVGKTGNPEIKEMTRNELMDAEETPIKDGLEAMINYNVRRELKQIEASSLVIAAEKDGAVTMDKSRELADLLNCSIRTVDTSHQMLPERPEEVGEIISEFVSTELN